MIVHPLSTGFGLSFLLEDKLGLYLIDSGSPHQEEVVLKKMRALGRSDLKMIWLTHAHYDHYGSAAALRDLTGAQIGIHPNDANSIQSGVTHLGRARGRGQILVLAESLFMRLDSVIKTRPDFLLEDGETFERFGLNGSVLHTPGHTPGHTSVLLEDGTAFAADLIARNPRPRLQDLLATDWELLPGSLQRLQAARPDRIYTGHSKKPLNGSELQKIQTGRS